MTRYRTRKVYEERYNNYVSNFHANQVRALNEDGTMVTVTADPIPVSKDRLKKKNKILQEAPATELATNEAGQSVRVVRPAWKVNSAYKPNPGYRLRLCMFDKAYERDSM